MKMHSAFRLNAGLHPLLRRAAIRIAVVATLVLVSVSCGGGTTTPPLPPTAGVAVQVGCYSSSYNGTQAGGIGCGFIQTFGNPILDQQYVQEIQIQSSFWAGIPTTVYAFDECSAATRNAISMPSGVIMFGRWLSLSVISQQGSSAALSGIMAHEWAHQAQFRFGWISQTDSTARNAELEADAFGGYFMVLGKGFPSSVIDQYFSTLEGMGDFNFNHPSHHGTPAQRHAAGALGVSVAMNQISTGTTLTYQQLHQAFSSQVATLALEGGRVGTEALPSDTNSALTHESLDFVRRVSRGEARIADLPLQESDPAALRHLWPSP